MERKIWFGEGPESHLWKAPGAPGNILDHIQSLKEQLSRREPFDVEKYERVLRVYKGVKTGDILTEAQLPTSGELTREIISNTFKETAREFLTGQRSDGSISWLGVAGRMAAAGVTGGASELVFTPADALIQMKNYVDRGGDSIIGGFARSAGAVVAGEIFNVLGPAVRSGIEKAASAAGRVAGGVLEQVATKGGSAARQVLDAFGSARKGLSNVASSIKEVLSRKKPALSTAVAPKPPGSVGSALTRIPAGPATGRSVKVVKANVSIEPYLSGCPSRAVSHAKVVADKHGVILDLRPANPESKVLLETGQAVPKRGFIKNKSLTPEDLLLGAKGKPGEVGHYWPKLPPKGNMTEAEYRRLVERFNMRMKEYLDEHGNIYKLKAQGKIEVKNGVIYEKATGKPMASDIDIFDIRDARTGKPLPRYAVDKDGNLIIDPATGQPKLHPVREQIIKELQNGPFQAQHGAHMDWKYDHLPSSARTPPRPSGRGVPVDATRLGGRRGGRATLGHPPRVRRRPAAARLRRLSFYRLGAETHVRPLRAGRSLVERTRPGPPAPRAHLYLSSHHGRSAHRVARRVLPVSGQTRTRRLVCHPATAPAASGSGRDQYAALW